MPHQTFYYTISGLTVQSDVALRSAIPCEATADPDVTIREEDLPAAPIAGSVEGLTGIARLNRFWLRIPATGRFLIEDGRQILYQPRADADRGELVLQLIGTCFSVILQQRGHLVLHASAVSVAGRAMLFCGESGSGKSTLAAMLCDRGYPLLNDDVCNLQREPDGRFVVRSDGRMIKLWATSLEQMDREPQGQPIRSGMPKFYTQPPQVDGQARPVAAIYVLAESASEEAPSLEPLRPAQAMVALRENAFRPGLVAAMDQQGSYFQASIALCQQADLYLLSRPKDFTRAGAVLDLLEAAWARRA